MNILVLPDIHGRTFWKQPCQNIDEYEKVIFLGDYFDPYDFEGITVRNAIDNFNEIVELKRNNMDKVVLLLGNHDGPYFSETYYHLSHYHSRHSKKHHNEISKLFMDNHELFQLAYTTDDILFTHAGVTYDWWANEIKEDYSDLNTMCQTINNLTNSKDGLIKLFCVSAARGGYDQYSSCIWCDVHDMININKLPIEENPFKEMKQIFGHTLQAYYGKNYEILYGKPLEFDNCKMLDTTHAYQLNTDTYTINEA